MNKLALGLILFFSSFTFAVDVLMTADEVSNTISVVNARNGALIGVTGLGPPRELALQSSVRPFIQTNVHGLSVSPDNKMVAVTSNISNSVVIYNLNNLREHKEYINVGLSPHTSIFSPKGDELWVATRGTSHVEIYDTKKFKLIKKVSVSPCPSFFAFLKKKPLVFISNTCSSHLEVFNTKTKKLHKEIELTADSRFSPFIALSPDQKELWVITRDQGLVTRINTDNLKVIERIPTGFFPQHVAFTVKDNKIVALVSVGGENSLKFYQYNPGSSDSAILVGAVVIPGVPHGIAVNPDAGVVYVAGEHSDSLYSISVKDLKLINTTRIGNSPQTLLYIKNFSSDAKLRYKDTADGNNETISFNLKSFIPNVYGADIAVRSNPQNIYTTFNVFGNFFGDEFFKFYMSDSSKKISEMNSGDMKIIGYVTCRKSLCLNYTSVPQDSVTIMKLKNAKIKIFAFDKNGKIALSN